jgi:hypothetical protein
VAGDWTHDSYRITSDGQAAADIMSMVVNYPD